MLVKSQNSQISMFNYDDPNLAFLALEDEAFKRKTYIMATHAFG